ncbi:MAG: V-type ATPase subunit [Eubacteriales bacterium]
MGTLLKYSGIITKVKAMSSNLLTENDFLTISQSNTVLEVVSFLKNHPAYSNAFSMYDERLLHRGDIEKILIESLYTDYSKLYSFGSSYIRNFLLFYLRRYEIDLINYCLRIVFNRYAEPFDLSHKREFFDKYSTISIDKLITSTTPEELVLNLEGTEYFQPLKQIMDATDATLFDYNLALDLYFYTTLWKHRKKVLDKKELDLFTNEIGYKIDLLNLQWIYRSKKYYTLKIAEIYSLLIPANYHLHKDQLKQLVEAPTIEDFTKIAMNSYYYKRFSSTDSLSWEQMYQRSLEHCYIKDCRNFPYSLAPINMYLYKKENEINKITTALECIRYGIAPSETLNYIGGIAQ